MPHPEPKYRQTQPFKNAIPTERGGYAWNYFIIPGVTIGRNNPDRQTIIRIVCEQRGVTFNELRSPCRDQPLVITRNIIWHFIMEFCPTSLKCAGLIFNRDHATVLFGINRLRSDMKLYPEVNKEVFGIRRRILEEYDTVKDRKMA